MQESFQPSTFRQPPREVPSPALGFRLATAGDASALATLHTAAAEHLTQRYGQGPWSCKTTEQSLLSALRKSRVFVAQEGNGIAATFHLTTTKPWAIDIGCFTPCHAPLYLLAMAVAPARQLRGIGRSCLREAIRRAELWPADALRLDAYDAAAGAGPFYAKCGWREVGRAAYRQVPLIYYELLL